MPKYVTSRTLDQAEWNATLIKSNNVRDEILKLKQEPGQNLLIYGSSDLVHTLIQEDLIDEYHLIVHPIILGKGKRLFKDGVDVKNLKLLNSKTTSLGVVILSYQLEKTK